MKYSFGMLKPDCIKRNLVSKATDLIERGGLKIIFSKRTLLEKRDVSFLYSRCKESPFFENLITFISSGEVVLYIVEASEGICAIRTLNSVTGNTDPAKAKPNTLRSLGISVCENIAHSTDNEKTFWSEVTYFLGDIEITNLKLEP